MRLLIAYNNDSTDNGSTHFSFCGEEMEIEAEMRQIEKVVLTPPDMTYTHLMEHLPTCQVCFIASHGDTKSIANEKNEDVALFKKHAIDYIQASEQRLQDAWCSMKDELKSKIKVVNLISRFNNETTQNCCSKK